VPTTKRSPNRSLLRPRGWTQQRAWGAIWLGLMAAAALALPAHAQSLPLIAPGAHACPSAALPLRVATFQFQAGNAVDPLTWVRVDEFRTAHAAVSLRPGHSPVHVVVVAYVAGDPADIELSITPVGASEPTWRHAFTPDVHAVMQGGIILAHTYYAAELADAAARAAFPTTGPYLVTARTVRSEPDPYVDGFCDAETTSWVFVAQR